MQRKLLAIAAIAETLVGLALLVVPRITIEILLRVPSQDAAQMVARLAGVALICLAFACWSARADAGGTARTGTLRGITLYNLGAGVLLAVFAATGMAGGVIVWIAAVFHLALAAGFLMSLRRPG